jgi:hypothetical protein
MSQSTNQNPYEWDVEDDYEPEYEPESVRVGGNITFEVLTVVRKFGCSCRKCGQ